MSKSYNAVKEQFRKLSRINHAITFLQWDQLVMMPPGGNSSRSESIAELSAMYHEHLTSAYLAELLQKCLEQENDVETSRSLVEMSRVHQQACCIPADLVKAKSLAGSRCEHGWRQQRKDNDWNSFLPNFSEVVNLSRQEARARQETTPKRHKTPYDALLDLYCTGDSSELIEQIFSGLRTELPALIEQISARQAKEKIVIQGPFSIDSQRKLNHTLMTCLGFNFNEGRLDESVHPFSTGDRGDHRITTRFRSTDFLEALLATAHETGHASYEAGLPARWDGLPVGSARNMSIHESQSLLFEKQLFLSKPFLSFFTSSIHECLPQTSEISSDLLWTACSHVQPSFIRVEADEVTYPLHVILRFEIESRLINDQIEASDVPEAWDDGMKQYLGLSTAGNYTDGCLQDIHWTDGSFGYFPSYTLGAVNSAQLFAAIKRRYADWHQRLAGGDVSFVHDWLQDHIWSKASSMDSQELMRQATGDGTNPKWFIDHLKKRYTSQDYEDDTARNRDIAINR